jgi:CBS domain-containing protein
MHSLVRDVMTTEVVTVEPTTPFKEVVARMLRHRVSALPVVDDQGRVLGVVSEADLLLKEECPDPDADLALVWTRRRRAEHDKAAAAVARDLMTVAVVSVGPDATVTEAARLLHRHGVKRLPVVDPAGPLLGIVSRADLLKVFLRPDDEIAADVRQEVLVRSLWVDPDSVGVDVRDGVVTLTGRLELRSQVTVAVSLVHALDGVVDDKPITVPADLLIDRAPGVRRRI